MDENNFSSSNAEMMAYSHMHVNGLAWTDKATAD